MALPKLTSVTYDVTIPSTGKRINIRPFNVKEQKILLIAKESGDSGQMVRAARDLIGGCTLGEVDVNELTTFDFEYLFLQARAKSVGETSDVRVACSSCNHKNDITIELEEAEVRGDLKKDLKVKLTDEVGIVMRYPSFKDAETLSKLDRKSSTASIDALTCCIDVIYDKDNVYPASDSTKKELEEFVESLSTKQFQEVAAVFNDMPAVSMDIDFMCIKCKEGNNIELTGLTNFF